MSPPASGAGDCSSDEGAVAPWARACEADARSVSVMTVARAVLFDQHFMGSPVTIDGGRGDHGLARALGLDANAAGIALADGSGARQKDDAVAADAPGEDGAPGQHHTPRVVGGQLG